MTIAPLEFQDTLFGEPQAAEAATLAPHRRTLGVGAWVDLQRGWLASADQVFTTLAHEVPWRAERRAMYDTVVDVPRLVCSYGIGERLPHPTLQTARDLLSTHYRDELGEPFVTAGLCWYRNGQDSVAWHGDDLGRGRTEDTMVAILSLGDARRLLLRPKGGGSSTAVTLSHGDLLVMGGSCQRTWEHCAQATRRRTPPLGAVPTPQCVVN